VVVGSTRLASLAGSFIGMQCFELWLAVWEAIRVGNGHLSTFRAATWNRWTQNHYALEFAAAVLLFWLVGAIVLRVRPGDTFRPSAALVRV
jgi:hypothetical protein